MNKINDYNIIDIAKGCLTLMVLSAVKILTH
jgi:hypothetical protein